MNRLFQSTLNADAFSHVGFSATINALLFNHHKKFKKMRITFICMVVMISCAFNGSTAPHDYESMVKNHDGQTVKLRTLYDNTSFVYMGVPLNKAKQNGTQVGMYDGQGDEAIEWIMELQDDGSYIIVLKASPNMALDAESKGLEKKGGKVQLYNKLGRDNQRWELINVNDKVYRLSPKASTNVLDLALDNRKNQSGTPIHLWKPHNGTNQQWLIETDIEMDDKKSDFTFDCDLPAILFEKDDFNGESRYLEESGDFLIKEDLLNPKGSEKLSSIRSVGINDGWHMSFPGDSGDRVIIESSQSGITGFGNSPGILKLARKLNKLEIENDCKTFVYLEVDRDIRNNIIVSRIMLGQPEAEVIGTIASNIKGLWVAEVEMGDILTFSFAKEELDFKISSIAVADYSEKTYLVHPEIQWKDARARYARIANAAANRYSFDATQIPPAYIDMPQNKGGGVRKQIFRDLGESDTDWTVVDGDIALKQQFALTVLDFGEGTENSESVWSKQGFMESSSTNISASGQFPMPGANMVNVKPSGSYGFSDSTEEQWENNEVFTYSRVTSHVYEIALQKEYADFTNEFVNAVFVLPTPKVKEYVTLEEAKADPAWTSFSKFVNNWGTHVPKKVIYGGFFMGVNTESFEDYNKKEISTTDLTANIEADATFDVEAGEGSAKVSKETGVKGAVGYSKSTEEVKTKGNGSSRYSYSFLYRGGQGSSFDNYSIGDNVQPVDIELEIITELFKDEYFDRKIPNLEAKKYLLCWAIMDYLTQNEKKKREIPIPSMYKLELYEVAVTSSDHNKYGDEGDHLEIWGEVKVNGTRKWTTGKDGKRIDADGKYHVVENNINETSFVYRMPDANGKFDPAIRFEVNAEFKEQDGDDGDDNLGKKKEFRYIKDVSEKKEKYEIRFNNENNEGIDLVVRAWVWKVPFKNFGITDPNNIKY